MSTKANNGPAGYETADAAPAAAEVPDVIAAQRARLAAATDMDSRLIFGVWGVAWLFGYGVAWAASASPAPAAVPAAVAWPVFVALIVSAVVVTAVHIARRSAGVRGTTARQGAMYGWSWVAAFAAFGALQFGLGRAGVSDDVASLIGATLPPLIVGVLYMAGGAIWDDRTQFSLGAWIVVVTAAAMLAGPPTLLLIMAVAGGGGLLVAAALAAVAARRQPRQVGGESATAAAGRP